MEGHGYKSLYVLVTSCASPYQGEIYEIQIQKGSGQIMGEGGGAIGVNYGKDQAPLLDPVTTFFNKKTYSIPNICLCDATDLFGASKLYLLLRQGMQVSPLRSFMTPDSLKGHVFDIQNKSFSTFEGPKVPKPLGAVISAYDKLYNLAIPITSPYRPNPESVFERYDPHNDSWEFLPPVPSFISDKGVEIVGYAVYNDNILLSLRCALGSKFIAFHVRTKEWRHVEADLSSRMALSHFPFRGRAVVLGNRMYASSNIFGVVIEFFFDCEAYSLTPKLVLPGLERMYPSYMDFGVQTEYLVHLGGWDFCLVQTAYDYRRIDRQPLWITTFRIVVGSGGSSKIEILHSTVRDVYIRKAWHFQVKFSFTPDCKNNKPQGEEEETRSQGKDAKGLKGKVWRITSSSQKKII